MNKKTMERLQKVATDLPPIFEMRLTNMTGAEVNNIPKYNYKDAKKFREKKTYQIPMPCGVDHLDRLKDAYRKKKEAGVEEYVKWVNQQAKEQRKMIDDQQKKKVNVA